jgi:sugar O-acyltransferase (sialic acid O-acetyltransferase NeuD family)
MSKNYYILGSGGFAKEVYFLADECLNDTYKFSGFIDFKPKTKSIIVRGIEEVVIDEDYFLENVKPSSDINIFHGVGDPLLLEKLSERFHNYTFPNLIHPNFVGDKKSIQLGNGNIITAGCIFTVDIKIGSNNVFNLNITIGHDCVIRDFNVFNPGANISGGVNIGSGNLFGTNCTVLQMLQIGKNNVIGASSLANKNIDDNSIMVGVPAKKIIR